MAIEKGGAVGDLFGPPPAQSHSAASRAAAATQAAGAAQADRRRILNHLERCGAYGATDEEIQLALELQGNTERPRRRELQNAGQVVESTFHRRTKTGHFARVWLASRFAGKGSANASGGSANGGCA